MRTRARSDAWASIFLRRPRCIGICAQVRPISIAVLALAASLATTVEALKDPTSGWIENGAPKVPELSGSVTDPLWSSSPVLETPAVELTLANVEAAAVSADNSIYIYRPGCLTYWNGSIVTQALDPAVPEDARRGLFQYSLNDSNSLILLHWNYTAVDDCSSAQQQGTCKMCRAASAALSGENFAGVILVCLRCLNTNKAKAFLLREGRAVWAAALPANPKFDNGSLTPDFEKVGTLIIQIEQADQGDPLVLIQAVVYPWGSASVASVTRLTALSRLNGAVLADNAFDTKDSRTIDIFRIAPSSCRSSILNKDRIFVCSGNDTLLFALDRANESSYSGFFQLQSFINQQFLAVVGPASANTVLFVSPTFSAGARYASDLSLTAVTVDKSSRVEVWRSTISPRGNVSCSMDRVPSLPFPYVAALTVGSAVNPAAPQMYPLMLAVRQCQSISMNDVLIAMLDSSNGKNVDTLLDDYLNPYQFDGLNLVDAGQGVLLVSVRNHMKALNLTNAKISSIWRAFIPLVDVSGRVVIPLPQRFITLKDSTVYVFKPGNTYTCERFFLFSLSYLIP